MRILCVLTLTFIVSTQSAGLAADPIHLQADDDHRWYKGNMHTHSLWSDGDDYPEMIACWYRDHDYQFLVYTDHNVLLQGERWIDVEKNEDGKQAFEKLLAKFPNDWVETRIEDERQKVRLKKFDEIFDHLALPQTFLLIQGEEISDRFGKAPIHLCATNTTRLLPPIGGDSIFDVMQRNISAATSHRERTGEATLVHLNHPNFSYAITAEDLMHVVGENFFEVYNGHPAVHNSGNKLHASTERMWDIINTWRLARLDLPLMYGLGTDDGHNYHEPGPAKGAQPGRGWVMVLAETLTPEALVESLEAGRFYASSGVVVKSVMANSKQLTVEVEPQQGITYQIDFIGTRHGFDDTSTSATDDPEKADRITRRYSDDVGDVFQSVTGTLATYEFTGDEIYVRALVTSSCPHPNPAESGEFERAWVQPLQPGTERQVRSAAPDPGQR